MARGCRNGRFRKRCFCPLPKTGSLTKIGEESDIAFYPQNKGFCSSNPGNRRMAGVAKMSVCQKHRFDNPEWRLVPPPFPSQFQYRSCKQSIVRVFKVFSSNFAMGDVGVGCCLGPALMIYAFESKVFLDPKSLQSDVSSGEQLITNHTYTAMMPEESMFITETQRQSCGNWGRKSPTADTHAPLH